MNAKISQVVGWMSRQHIDVLVPLLIMVAMMIVSFLPSPFGDFVRNRTLHAFIGPIFLLGGIFTFYRFFKAKEYSQKFIFGIAAAYLSMAGLFLTADAFFL